MHPMLNEYSQEYRKNNQSRNKNKKQDNNSEIDKIIKKIENVSSFSEIKPKDYADEDGYAAIIAKELKKLNTNQLRKFFGAVRNIEKKNEEWSNIEPELYLLKPKLAISLGRNLIPEDFFKVMNACLNKIDVGETDDDEKKENFNNFVKFFEAIVAYHKYYESIGE
ncbi:type III-A CRISPR-associated protein Csm2 [uncultured Methanosphaera sp.]|uniref:type III-A CRISPR-associated protein Csm2 n=1 Tax=uncultured Methanosphaera sp. TaxID=262501 RepID=UPI002593CC44|nr:type III-A CRISPR-associated protein Csm2 [uncultured Methanosphaera sp.]